eukprot:4357845-Pleurochrysis_carterae.AAC.2
MPCSLCSTSRASRDSALRRMRASASGEPRHPSLFSCDSLLAVRTWSPRGMRLALRAGRCEEAYAMRLSSPRWRVDDVVRAVPRGCQGIRADEHANRELSAGFCGWKRAIL